MRVTRAVEANTALRRVSSVQRAIQNEHSDSDIRSSVETVRRAFQRWLLAEEKTGNSKG
jgi:hypothetical protein